MDDDVGELLRTARRQAGLSQAELARRAGTSQAFVSQVESGRTSPTAGRLRALLAAADARLEVGTVPARGTVDDDSLRAFRGLGPEERLAQAFAASAFASRLHGRAAGG